MSSHSKRAKTFKQHVLLPLGGAEGVNQLSPSAHIYRSAGRDKVAPYQPPGEKKV